MVGLRAGLYPRCRQQADRRLSVPIAGLDFPFADRWGVYLEGMWRDAKMTIRGDGFGVGTGPTDLGVDLNGPQVNLGIKFGW